MTTGITLKHSSHEKILGVTIDNKLSSDEHNNICKAANKNLNVLSSINHYIKQIQKELLLSSLISAIVPSFGCFAPKNLPEI